MRVTSARPSPRAASFGRYQLVAELGAGGMANVYLAVAPGGGRDPRTLLVLKVPREDALDDPTVRAMFHDEGRLATRLVHPNIVRTFEVLEADRRDALAMEYIEGRTLAEITTYGRRRGRPLPLALHLHVVLQALEGLDYAHELRDVDGRPLAFVHRDVSPHNVAVAFDGRVKLLDFGVAKAAISSQATRAGTIKGKVRYMPPEQLRGRVDRRADVFAAGAMLWEAATGKRLWSGSSDAEVVAALERGAVPSPRSAEPTVDAELDAIVRRALAVDVDARYPSCAELRDALEVYARTLPAVGAQELGAFVVGAFGDARAQRRAMLEDRLARLDAPDALPSFFDDAFAGGGSGILVAGERTASFVGPPADRPAERPALVGVPVPSARARRAAELLALGLGVATVLGLARGLGEGPGPVREATAGAGPTLRLAVAVTPPHAHLTLDGLPVAAVTEGLAREEGAHVLRASADGYEPAERVVRLDRDLVVALVLEARTPPVAVAGLDASKSRSVAAAPPVVSTPRAVARPPRAAAVGVPSSPPAAAIPTASAPSPGRPARPIDERLEDAP